MEYGVFSAKTSIGDSFWYTMTSCDVGKMLVSPSKSCWSI